MRTRGFALLRICLVLALAAGLAAGARLVEAGASHLLCVQHELDNAALKIRCDRAGFRVGQVTILQWIAGGGIQLGPNFVDATNVERVRSARPGQS